MLLYGQHETRRCNCALVGCLLNDAVSDAGVASGYWIMMNNELQRKRPWPIIMPRKCIQSHGKFQDIWCSGQDLNRGSSGYSADEQTARCGESERHLVLAGGSSVQQARGQSADQPTKQTPHPTLDTTRPPALPGSSPAKNASVQIRASYLQTGRTSAGRWTWQRASSRLAGCRL